MVSVIVPVYNVEKYLEECLDSILGQTYKDLEVILIDDGSTDSSGSICDRYAEKDKRIKVIHKENGGPSDARNCALKYVHGEYIYCIDSDDRIRKDTIELLVDAAMKNNADIVFFNAIVFFDNSIKCAGKWEIASDYPADKGTQILKQRLNNKEWYPGVPVHMFRTAFLKDNKLHFKKGIIYEDQLFTAFAYLKAKKVCFVNEALYYYRGDRFGSIMNSRPNSNSFKCYHTCIKSILSQKKKYPEKSDEHQLLDTLTQRICHDAMEQYCLLSRGDRKAVEKDLWQLWHELKLVTNENVTKLRAKLEHPTLWIMYNKTVGRCVKSINNHKYRRRTAHGR